VTPHILPRHATPSAARDASAEASERSIERERTRLPPRSVSQYLRILAGIHASFAVCGVIFGLSFAPRGVVVGAVAAGALAAGVMALAGWTERLGPEGRAVPVVEALATAGLPAATTVLGLLATDEAMLDFDGALVAATLLVRVALVPSTPARTLVVGGITVAFTTAGILAAIRFGGLTLQPSAPDLAGLFMFVGVMVAVTARVSHVIYGLRLRVRKAEQLGQYTLLEKIGEGGMGTVWRARHAMLRRMTAVKVLHSPNPSAAELVRFEREVQLTARLRHPNTVAVFDFGRSETGSLYYAMEFVEGLSLEALVDRHGPQPAPRVIHILRQVASALVEAHELGLIHRDIKPANILLTSESEPPDRVKVVDFGLVKAVGPALGETKLDVTLASAILGTPSFMAPEMIVAPASVDGRADIYGLGAVAYVLLSGQPVFEGSNLVEICSRHLHDAPRPVRTRAPGVPPALDALITSCLAKDREARPVAAELVIALEALALAHPWTREEARAWWSRAKRSTDDRAP